MKETNIVKQACREFGITHEELGSQIGYGRDAIAKVSMSGKISIQMQKAIELYLENCTLKSNLKDIKVYSSLPKHLQKRYYHLMMADLALLEANDG